MSIKNQSRLTIFAIVIVVIATASLLGLNLVIDKISKASPQHLAIESKIPKAPTFPAGGSTDDRYLGETDDGGKAVKRAAPSFDQSKQGIQPGAGLRKYGGAAKPPAPNANKMPMQGGFPPGYPGGGGRPMGMPPGGPGQGGPYPGAGMPPGFNPNDPAMMQEMERQRQMMYQQGPPGYPPQGYYPPPPPMPDYGPSEPYYPEPYYDMPPPYYDGPPPDFYDYGYDYEAKNDFNDEDEDREVLAKESGEFEDPNSGHRDEDFVQDEYLREYLDDDR